MKNVILASMVSIVLSIGVILLIFVSNDHSECFQIKEVKTLDNGKTIVTTNQHICKEQFNL